MRKKLATSVILASFVFAMGSFAYAETTLESLGTVDFADEWIDGTNLLEKPDDAGKVGIADMDGNTLSANSYDNVGYHSGYGFITVYNKPADEINGTGVVDLKAQEIVPCEYGEVDFENEHWISAIVLNEATADQYDYESWIGDGYYLIDHVDFYYVDGDAASKVSTLTRDEYKDCNAYGRFINIESRADGSITAYDGTWTPVETPEPLDYVFDEAPGADEQITSYYENGQYGLKDAAGNVILGPTYGYIGSFEGDYAEATNYLETGNVTGLIDKTGAVVVPVEYEYVMTSYNAPATAENGYSRNAYKNNGYFAVVKESKLGYLDENGNVTCDFTIAKDNCDNNGASATYTDMGGALHLLAADGTDTDVSQYNSVYPLDGGNGMLYKVTNADYKYGVIDWHGDEVAEVKYNSVSLSGDGQYLLVQAEYGEPSELYKVTYVADTGANAGVAVDTQTTEAAADAAAGGDTTLALAQTEAAAQDGGSDLSSVSALIDSAITLVKADVVANKDAILSVLNGVATTIAESKPEAKAVIDTAITFLGQESIDGNSIVTVLESAKALLA